MASGEHQLLGHWIVPMPQPQTQHWEQSQQTWPDGPHDRSASLSVWAWTLPANCTTPLVSSHYARFFLTPIILNYAWHNVCRPNAGYYIRAMSSCNQRENKNNDTDTGWRFISMHILQFIVTSPTKFNINPCRGDFIRDMWPAYRKVRITWQLEFKSVHSSHHDDW